MLRCLLSALAALAFVAALPAVANARSTQESIIQDDRLLLYSSNPARASFMDEISNDLGADTIHSLIFWARIAPDPEETRKPGFDATDPDAYPEGNWDVWDSLIREADQRGLSVILTPTGAIPAWASECRGSVRVRSDCRPDPDEFGKFVTALARRYSGDYRDENEGGGVLPRIRRWSIWNEPNQGGWLTPQFTRKRGRTIAESPQIYRELVLEAVQSLRRHGHSRDQILIGETAPIGRESGRLSTRPVSPVDFYRELFCLDSRGRRLSGREARLRKGCTRFRKLRITGVAHHPYTRGAGGSPRSSTRSDWITINTLGRLERELNRAARYRRIRRGAPIYLTEFGFQTNPPDKRSGVRLSRQAQYLNEANYLAYKRGRVRAIAQYELNDEPDVGTFNTGLRFADGRPKPSYEAYRTPLWVERRGGRIIVFGQARPADRGDVVEIQFRERGDDYRTIATSRVNSAGYFTRRFRLRSGYWRLRWENEDGKLIYSRTAKAARR